jgi:Domain of unknown function (DUF1905)
MTSPDRDIPMDLDVQFEFSGEMWPWRGPAPYHFVTVPHEVSLELRALSSLVSYGWGVIPVGARIGETDWETSLFPKDGLYALPIKDAVRHAEDLTDGDEVDVELIVRSTMA